MCRPAQSNYSFFARQFFDNKNGSTFAPHIEITFDSRGIFVGLVTSVKLQKFIE